jgi:hypothetical protein
VEESLAEIPLLATLLARLGACSATARLGARTAAMSLGTRLASMLEGLLPSRFCPGLCTLLAARRAVEERPRVRRRLDDRPPVRRGLNERSHAFGFSDMVLEARSR